jgi:hypothetical protein
VVNTTTSDSAGNYAFAPAAPPTAYYVQGSMTGTTTTTNKVLTLGATGSTCMNSPNPSNCSISLPNVQLNGTVVVDPPPAAGTNTVVTVMAEPTGTGNLVGLTQVVVPAAASTPFAMEVPTGGNVDLIASAEDSYLGVGTPYSGHQLAVASNVNPATTMPTLTVTCLGHGTIAGVATSADSATSVRLFQPAGGATPVQLMESSVGQTLYPNQYSFCAPPNTYIVQRFQQNGPSASPSPGAAQTVVVPTPAATATSPCPVCANPAGQCPGNCSATMPSSLP